MFQVKTTHIPGDTHTPVGVYLRLRDVFPQCLLLECTDYSSRQNAFSYICITPIAGITATEKQYEITRPDGSSEIHPWHDLLKLPDMVDDFLESLPKPTVEDTRIMPGVFGYTSYDAVNGFDNVNLKSPFSEHEHAIPLLKYDLYQVVIAFNHFNSLISITEILPEGKDAISSDVLSIISNRNNTFFPFRIRDEERILTSDKDFKEQVNKGVQSCARGDVIQLVLSRKYQQDFTGDEFNVYRALRSINPSPYLFYFDYLDFKLFGSSPEVQLQVGNGKATINPIAGTVIRTGKPGSDQRLIEKLLTDPKENSEHAMLVDLARNDLSRHAYDVMVDSYREVHTYSHVIHLVSTVTGTLNEKSRLYRLFADSLPAGTLSGAPKHMAIQLIDKYERKARGFYGGAIGFMGFDHSLNHAIMIRSFMSKNGTLHYQAGAGVVVDSSPEGELNEVNGKISALRKAIIRADSTTNKDTTNDSV